MTVVPLLFGLFLHLKNTFQKKNVTQWLKDYHLSNSQNYMGTMAEVYTTCYVHAVQKGYENMINPLISEIAEWVHVAFTTS